MDRPSKIMRTSALALGFLLSSTAAWADETPECNDSAFQGTECGRDSNAADFATAVGFMAEANGDGSVAVGHTARATGFVAVAIGQAALASGDNSTAVGFLAQARGTGATATGAGARARGDNSVANGINAAASGNGAIAIGANSVARGDDNIAIGDAAVATGANSTAIGAEARATGANSVALGANSVATEANTVSVGTVGGERRIVNVAAGINATDAVNVAQLNAMAGANNAALTAERNERIAGDEALEGLINNETQQRAAADAALGVRIDDVEFDVRRARREARTGTSAALAAAAMPQAMDPGRSMVSAGVGTYRGRTALSIGGSHRVANGSSVFKVGITYDSSENVGANAGVGFQF